MVLAEFSKFKHGLYKSCGAMLEPCLLQPCFRVAGLLARAQGRAADDDVEPDASLPDLA